MSCWGECCFSFCLTAPVEGLYASICYVLVSSLVFHVHFLVSCPRYLIANISRISNVHMHTVKYHLLQFFSLLFLQGVSGVVSTKSSIPMTVMTPAQVSVCFSFPHHENDHSMVYTKCIFIQLIFSFSWGVGVAKWLPFHVVRF